MPHEVKPFRVPSSESWRVGEWQLLRDGDWRALPDVIEDWDADTDLHIRQMIDVDREVIVEQSGLALNAALVVTASWSSSSNQMTDLIDRVSVTARVVTLEATLPAGRVGGVLTITTSLALGESGNAGAVASPQEPGSVLLESTSTVALQGDGAMFPVAVIDFAATPFDVDSSWVLEVSSDLDAPFLGVFQLLVNERDEELVGAITRPSSDAADRQLLFALEEGVAGVLAEAALAVRTELRDGEPWEAGTVGSVLVSMLDDVESRGLSLPGSGPEAASDFRSRLSGVVRSLGYGRSFT
ncbi:hypothetical protein DEI92_09620 [Curtobacterium sp. MCBD17_034]|uniref:hypothetical protein n=1 Tax=unclassified Curtobacterium TaxID=257496 RepID=UPI000DA6F339|nr:MULTISPECIES: hypothetical protein [unclassified Curtobacterium]PZF59239.1 hypothetical protein DEI92_09620 [Curtobacterium sp. MCBD17_034]PZM34219.1 hypothetical protein DEI90_08515 [Curtobacterium sp. MCBD17_031]